MSTGRPIRARREQEGPEALKARSIVSLLSALPVLLGLASNAVHARQGACDGEDLIEKLRVEEPARYQRIRDHFATVENGNGNFWKVEKPGLPASYLFGTAHLADERITAWLPRIRPMLESSRLLFVELADLDPSLMASSGLLQQYGMLPDGETLDSRLTDEEQKLLGALSASHGMPWFSARRMKPGLLAIMLGIPPCAKIPMLRGEKVLDALIIEAAKDSEVPVIGLETLESQLSKLSELDQDKMLAGVVEAARMDARFLVDIFETTVRTHQTGEIAMMLSLMHELRKDFPNNAESMETIKDVLLDTRNIGMHERALGEMEKGGVFLAVGALHLPGKRGLVQLFQDSGFTVTPVRPSK